MAFFVFLKIDQKGTPFGLFSKKINFVKWGMIYTGNLIIKTLVFEYFNNSLYFKSSGRFKEKKTHLVPYGTKITKIIFGLVIPV